MIPIYLKLHNFLSHIDSEVDFNKFQVALITGVFEDDEASSNGAGKSGILNSIFWVLFGKSVHRKKDGVVRRGCRSCSVEFIFELNGERYRITRSRDKVVGESGLKFDILDLKGWRDISNTTNTETDEKIVEVIGFNSEIFLNSVYFRQNDISIFAEATPSNRKDILKALLKIDLWDDYQKVAKDKFKELSIKLEEKKRGILSEETLNEQITVCISKLKEVEKSLNKAVAQRESLSKELSDNKIKQQSMLLSGGSIQEDLKRIKKEAAITKKRMDEITNTISSNISAINAAEAEAAVCQHKVPSLNEAISQKKDIDVESLHKKLIQGKTIEKVLKEQITSLKEDIHLGSQCHVCSRPLSAKDITDIKNKRKAELEEKVEKHSHIADKLKKAEKITKEKEELLSKGNKSELDKSKLMIKINRYKEESNSLLTVNVSLENELKTLKSRNFDKEIKNLEGRFNQKDLDELEKIIPSIEVKINSAKKECDDINKLYNELVAEKNTLNKQKESQKEINKEVETLTNEIFIYDRLKNYFGRDGIQSVILENVIEEFENYTNEVLAKICKDPTSITIKTQKQAGTGSWSETLDIEITSAGRTDDFETFSGGEGMRISLALRLALSKILSRRMGGQIGFLLLDEVGSSLDARGLGLFVETVKQLSSEYKIMMISHDNRLKEYFNDSIVVFKNAEGSRILQEKIIN